MEYLLTTQRFASLQEAGRRWTRAGDWLVLAGVALLEIYRKQRELRRARLELEAMSERDLRDIGLSRADIDYVSLRKR